MKTTSAFSNNCHNCKYRWEDPADGHCYMWKHEPPVCLLWSLDERELRRLYAEQRPAVGKVRGAEMSEPRTVEELLDLIGGRIDIGPILYKQDGDSWLMGNRIREYDRHGSLKRDEVVYNVRLFWN